MTLIVDKIIDINVNVPIYCIINKKDECDLTNENCDLFVLLCNNFLRRY